MRAPWQHHSGVKRHQSEVCAELYKETLCISCLAFGLHLNLYVVQVVRIPVITHRLAQKDSLKNGMCTGV